ncbi:MAG TPA: hypothetical protein VFO89_15365 [Thermoanaerobaculia bacterium]|nr:hypothetical protein [Thermoanaerobaculia bacterium]
MSFESLLSVPQNVAVEAGYLTIRVLKHLSGEVIAPDKPFGQASVEARDVAERLIHEISASEHRTVPRLDRARVDYYISKIAEIVQARVRDTVDVDADRGEALLAELRLVEPQRRH